MPRAVTEVPGLAPAVGPFSPAVVAGSFVFTSGQIPMRPDGSTPDDLAACVRQALENLRVVLEAAGSGLDLVVKASGYLTDPEHMDVFNEVWREFFIDRPPARTTVAVAIRGILLEVDCVAVVREITPTR